MSCLATWNLDANVLRAIWFFGGLFSGWLVWRKS